MSDRNARTVAAADQGARADRAALGQRFLVALGQRDFAQLTELFTAGVRFRALVPPGVCQGQTAAEAAGWLRRWFGQADTLQVLQADTQPVFDRLYLHYRLRTHDAAHGWRLIEQQAYCQVQNGRIADMWLLCSGFRPAAGPSCAVDCAA